jgi:hypothetical protein
LYPMIVEHLAPYHSKVEGVVAEGIAAGEIRDDQPSAQLALMFVGMLTLLYVQHWDSAGVWPVLDELPELVVAAFLNGAAVRRGDER